VAKDKPVIPSGLSIESFVLLKLIAEKSNVLFIYEKDYNRISKLIQALNIKATILNDDLDELERARSFGFDVIHGNLNTGILKDYSKTKFDYIVCENHLHSARYPLDVLNEMVDACENLILSNNNQAHWRKRLKFFFRGSFFVDNQYDIIPDDEYAWYNNYPWKLTHKDIVNLCVCSNLTIHKGIIIYNDSIIDNMYDIRSYPNWSAKKVYYLISNSSTTAKISYQFGGRTFG